MSYVKNLFAAVLGRPLAIETGEQMVVADNLLATMISPKDKGAYILNVDDLVARKGYTIYKEMLHDDQVKSCLAFKKILVTGRKFDIEPYDDTPEAKKQALFLEEALCRVGIKKALKEAASAFEFGFSIAEQVYQRDIWDEDGQTYVFLKKLAHRDPQGLYLNIDAHGNYQGVKQQVAGVDVNLTPDRTWLFTHEGRFGNPYGVSDLRSAYRAWFVKKFVVQFWNVFLERMGAPLTAMKYPAGASNDLKNTLKGILTNLASKTEVLVPAGVEIDLIEATRAGNASYLEALNYSDKAIARALLMVSLLGMDGVERESAGTNSQSSLHLRVLFKMADELSVQLSDSFMEQVARPLLTLNFPEVLMPKFIWQDYGQYEGMKVADEIRQLFAAGILDMDQADVNYTRSILGLPLRDEDDNPDEVQRPVKMPPPGNGAPPPAAPQGNDRADKGGSAETDSTGA